MSALPLFFGLLAAASLLTALSFLWKSLRINIGGLSEVGPESVSLTQERARLLEARSRSADCRLPDGRAKRRRKGHPRTGKASS